MSMKDSAYVIGKNEKPGAEGEWKIIKFENGLYMMCTRKLPGKFTYMKKDFIGEVEGSYGDPGLSVLWKLET